MDEQSTYSNYPTVINEAIQRLIGAEDQQSPLILRTN
jgi:hypothetical protein